MRLVNYSFGLLYATLGAALAIGEGGAVIEGQVPLPDPPRKGITQARYAVKAPGVVAEPEPRTAVVYLEGEFPPAVGKVPRAEMGQRGFRFMPRLLAVQAGTEVIFPNYDDDYHNVLSYSRAKEFDLGRYRKEEVPPGVLFEEPGVVELDCEIHPHMRATILVLETPYFVQTDAEGRFRLENLPGGDFTLKAWVDYRTVLERRVQLREGERVEVEFE